MNLLSLSSEPDMAMAVILALPIIVNEIGIGIGRIVKGFGAAAVSHRPTWVPLRQGNFMPIRTVWGRARFRVTPRNALRVSMNAAHKRWWQVFEVIFGVPFIAGIGLQLAAPVSRPRGLGAFVIFLVGGVLVALGFASVVLARRELARHGQPTDPGLPTTRLVTTGVFSVSRNPLYLGGIFLLAGIALVLNLPWSLVLLLPAFVACHYLLVAPEERYLAAGFDRDYARYAASVRRWLGRARAR